VWVGQSGTSQAGNVGLQCLDSVSWIWEDLRLPIHETDIYSRPPEAERRLLTRAQCFMSAEIQCRDTKVLAFVRDLSLGGCYIATSLPSPLEAKVSIGLWLGEQLKVWTDGIVISRHAGIGMGIKFLGTHGPILNAIDRCVRELSTAERSSLRIVLPPE
jgi:PilZ domain